jgi:glutamyl-Q tRNA(Asp) synthetase
VAAVGAWLFARAAGGAFLVRIEDLDRAREVAGASDEILRALALYGLEPDAPVVSQSRRTSLYEKALERLRAAGAVYDCGCTRADLERAASAPEAGAHGEEGPVYPGTCRAGLAGRPARSVRFRAPQGEIAFHDAVFGDQSQDVARSVGDFVVQRADGPFAYQFAVVVDDDEQGVTQVVRGADLVGSTARQIALMRALGLPEPAHAHLPLVVGPSGAKLGKRDGALPLSTLDETRVRETLRRALRILGQETQDGTPREILAGACRRFDVALIPRGPVVAF